MRSPDSTFLFTVSCLWMPACGPVPMEHFSWSPKLSIPQSPGSDRCCPGRKTPPNPRGSCGQTQSSPKGRGCPMTHQLFFPKPQYKLERTPFPCPSLLTGDAHRSCSREHPVDPRAAGSPGLCQLTSSSLQRFSFPLSWPDGHPWQQAPAPSSVSVGYRLSWENSSLPRHGTDIRDEGSLCRQHPAKLHKAGGGVQSLLLQGSTPLHLPPCPGTGFCIALAGFVNSPPRAGAPPPAISADFTSRQEQGGKKGDSSPEP